MSNKLSLYFSDDKNFISFLKLLFALLLSLIIVFQVLNICLEYDDAYNATIAKNVAFGYGYVSSYNGIHLFPYEISIGYPLILPVAVAIKIFSNKYWVPNVASSFLFLVLLLSIMYLVGKIKFITDKQLWIWRCVFAALIIVASNLRNVDSFIVYGGEIARYNGAFSMMLGEFSATLFVLISVLFLIISENKKNIYFAAGFFASMAFLTKTIAILSIAPAFFLYLFFNFEDIKSKVNFVFYILLGFLLPIAGIELYKLIKLGGFDLYLSLKKLEYDFIKGAGLGLVQGEIVTNFVKIKIIISEIGFLRFALFVIMPVWSVVFCFLIKTKKTVFDMLSAMLAGAVLVNVLWWILMSPYGWIRHLLIGWFLFLAMVSFYVFSLNDKNRWFYIVVIILFLTVPCSSRIAKMFLMLDKYVDIQTSEKKALLEARDFIENNRQYRYYGGGWWSNRQLEYILPTINNFSDVLDPTQFNPGIKNKVLVREIKYWSVGNGISYASEQIRQQSEEHIIFQNSRYVMSLYEE